MFSENTVPDTGLNRLVTWSYRDGGLGTPVRLTLHSLNLMGKMDGLWGTSVTDSLHLDSKEHVGSASGSVWRAGNKVLIRTLALKGSTPARSLHGAALQA